MMNGMERISCFRFMRSGMERMSCFRFIREVVWRGCLVFDSYDEWYGIHMRSGMERMSCFRWSCFRFI